MGVDEVARQWFLGYDVISGLREYEGGCGKNVAQAGDYWIKI